MRPRVAGVNASQKVAKEMVDSFCEAALKRGLSKITVKNYRSDLQGVIRWFSERTNKPLVWQFFFTKYLAEYQHFLSTSVRVTTANRNLAGLRAFLTWLCEKQGAWSPYEEKTWFSKKQLEAWKRKPLPKVRRIVSTPGDSARPRWLTKSEQAVLSRTVRETANAQGRTIILLLLHTGIRTSQLRELKWSDVLISGGSGRVRIPRPSIGIDARIPLNRMVREELLALGYMEHNGSSTPILRGRSGFLSRRWIEARVRKCGEDAHIINLTPLVLRNTFIANMLGLGVNPVIISDVLGDPVLDLLRYYAPAAPEDLETAVEEVANEVLGKEQYELQSKALILHTMQRDVQLMPTCKADLKQGKK
jgi:integrase/recombinase XerD